MAGVLRGKNRGECIGGDVGYYIYLYQKRLVCDKEKENYEAAMPGGARLDAPGTLHYVMVGRINGREIIIDDDDRSFFVSRLGQLAKVTETSIYAWALMSNHAHILLKQYGKYGNLVW